MYPYKLSLSNDEILKQLDTPENEHPKQRVLQHCMIVCLPLKGHIERGNSEMIGISTTSVNKILGYYYQQGSYRSNKNDVFIFSLPSMKKISSRSLSKTCHVMSSMIMSTAIRPSLLLLNSLSIFIMSNTKVQ